MEQKTKMDRLNQLKQEFSEKQNVIYNKRPRPGLRLCKEETITKEGVLEFLESFRKRTGMYIPKHDDFDVVRSFLWVFFYCCFLRGFDYHYSYETDSKTVSQHIDCVIREIEALK